MSDNARARRAFVVTACAHLSVSGCELASRAEAQARPTPDAATSTGAGTIGLMRPGAGLRMGGGYGSAPGPRFHLEESSANPATALPAEALRRIVRRHLPELRTCYDHAFAVDAGRGPTGQLVLRIEIDAQGNVHNPAVTSGDAALAPLHACLTTAAARWVFPAPTGATTVTLTQPLRIDNEAPAAQDAGLTLPPGMGAIH